MSKQETIQYKTIMRLLATRQDIITIIPIDMVQSCVRRDVLGGCTREIFSQLKKSVFFGGGFKTLKQKFKKSNPCFNACNMRCNAYLLT